MLLSSGLMTAPWGEPRFWRPDLEVFHDALAPRTPEQLQHSAVGRLSRSTTLHELVVGDRVEVALQVGVHHVCVALS